MAKRIKHIVIVGGGTAGWLSAGTIAATTTKKFGPGVVKVTLIESSQITPVGVGEGTWPTMRATLENMGISESEFIRNCNATFKQGSTFHGWLNGHENDHYHHPFSLPIDFFNTNLAWHWMHNQQNMPFAELVSPQQVICQHRFAPKLATHQEYSGLCNYGYHLDAGAFAEFLKLHCVEKLAVKHIIDHVTQINSYDEQKPTTSDIRSISTKQHGDIEGDLFVDCSGQKSLLLGQHFKVPYISKKKQLFIDSALAVHMPTSRRDNIASTTLSSAQSAGWIWDIALQHRRGIGHVYASDYISEYDATEQLKQYLVKQGSQVVDIERLDVRRIKFNPGYRSKFWQNNCVAVGLSAGFVEPLEASSLALVELSAQMIAEQLPVNRQVMDVVAERYNQRFLYRWQRVIDFLKLHYVLSKRKDSQFWRDNRDVVSIPNSLQKLFRLWQHQVPWHYDFEQAEIFPSASYQYVICGMQFKTNLKGQAPSLLQQQIAVANYNHVQSQTGKLLAQLKSHRAVIEEICSSC